MNEAYQQILALISASAQKGALKKAVLSKPQDAANVKCTLTLRQVGGKTVLQAETLRADNKALHENIAIDDVVRLGEIAL
ncbi:MAG: hypothetical protein J6V22_04580, partial [Clostridia bacterium]|nr:hypothetical protein [Clostridia bacterium]